MVKVWVSANLPWFNADMQEFGYPDTSPNVYNTTLDDKKHLSTVIRTFRGGFKVLRLSCPHVAGWRG